MHFKHTKGVLLPGQSVKRSRCIAYQEFCMAIQIKISVSSYCSNMNVYRSTFTTRLEYTLYQLNKFWVFLLMNLKWDLFVIGKLIASIISHYKL